MAFDFTSAVLASDVAPYIHDEKMRAAAVGIFVVAGLFNLIAWILVIRFVETRIHHALREKQRLSRLSQFLIFLSWATVVSFTGLQFLIFGYR